MQRRTTIWVAGLLSLIFGTSVHALSLGDVEVYSALNQPLEAEILLTSVRPGETEGMLIRLASEEAFAQAGVERPFYLTKIKFQLAAKPDGTQYILATTDYPVREPFLSFLIDIDWPRGHLVREYTVLLDPPVFTSTASQGPAAEALPADALPEVADTESAAGEPALIQRDAAEEELPDIEMVDETDAFPADQTGFDPDIAEKDEPAFEEAPVEDTATAEDTLDAAVPLFEEERTESELDQAEEDSSLSARLEQQSLPDINVAFDESLPYDAARTEALLAEFGISLGTSSTAGEQGDPTEARADSYEVQAGDTLWEIANRRKDADVSVQQAMLAILRYNPNGFIRNNINDVKKGFVLRMPEREAMLEISRQEAAAEAQRQHTLWREYRGELAGITSAKQDALAADRFAQEDTAASRDTAGAGGQLSILAPGRDAKSTTRSSGAQEGEEKGSASSQDLQLAREQLEAERLEKTELKSRLTDLTGQIETMQRLLTLKDEQLAKLQERLRKLEAAATAPAISPAPAEPKAKAKEVAPVESPADKASDERNPLPEKQPDDVAAGAAAPGASVPAAPAGPDAAEVAPQPETTAQDMAKDEDIAKLNESLNKPPQPEVAVEPKVKKPKSEKPVTEVAPNGGKSFPERLNAVLQPLQGFSRDLANQHLPAPYNKMADDLLATPAGLGILAGLLILILVLLITLLRSAGKVKDKKAKKAKPAKVIIGSQEHLETPAEQVATAKFSAKKKVSLGERLKKAFAPFAAMAAARKQKSTKAPSQPEEDEAVENEVAAAEEDLTAAVQEAAVEVKTKAKPAKAAPAEDLGKTVVIKPAPKAAMAAAASAPAAEEEVSDDTTAEADVYLAYGLFDQAEELLKHALATNPGATHYRGKLLETYFAAGKKDEFEKLAAELKKSIGNRSSRIWDKAVAMGKEIAPSNPLFSGAADTGLKASDFAPAKPATADLDIGEAGGSMTPDIDFGEGATETALDLDISGAFDKTLIADSDDKTMIADDSTMIADDSTMIADDSTMIADDSTMIADDSTMLADPDSTMIVDDSTLLVDETSLDGPKPRDVTDSEMNIDFDADELGLGADLEIDAGDDSAHAAEATMAMDIGLDIDNIDGITDVDGSGTFNSTKSAGDDLIAELGGDVSELSLESSSDTEFDLPEDDDTIIDAGDDTFSGDSGSDVDEVSTKLDLAKAYMDMGDYDGASSTLEEVLSEGNDKQKREAEELLDQIN